MSMFLLMQKDREDREDRRAAQEAAVQACCNTQFMAMMAAILKPSMAVPVMSALHTNADLD